jgi:OPA family glycerol-3-phosphate transporter-like MFS transporter
MTPSAQFSHPPGYRMRRGQNWFFLGLTYASYYLCRYNLDPVAPDLINSLHLQNADFGKIKTWRDGAYAIGQMVNGLFTDRLGGKKAMTIGAIATIVLNLAFGFTAWSAIGITLPLLIVIRAADGYFQAFGAPGFIKINTAWFRRKERGAFAGIFGAMINLGQAGANQLAQTLASGAAIPLLLFTLTIPSLEWHYMFFIPPIVVAVVILCMNFAVKNTPEEAGFTVQHDDEAADSGEQVRLLTVFKKIASNKVIWFVAAAYLCTGFVRGSVASWWAKYLIDVWQADRKTTLYSVYAWALPITATLGSMASGYVSDLFFKGRRAPVAAALYFAQALVTLWAMTLTHGSGGSVALATIAVLTIATMCNSTHSILGAAAPMDLGGRKMAGCAAGIIDSFQYYGSMLSGYFVGKLFDHYADVPASAGSRAAPVDPTLWFGAMLPFGLLGFGLMTYVWIRHRKSDTVGA